MRIGVSLASQHDVDDPREGARRMIERARAARDAGLWCLSVGDHHANRRPYYQNTPMLGRLLAEWGERPAGCLFLTPLWNPVLMAEQIGTLAALAGEPFIIQTGIGHGHQERRAMGTDARHRGRSIEHAVPVVRALLAGEVVDDDWFGLRGARISPVPPGATEWWMGTNAPEGIERAARLGACWYAGFDLELCRAGMRRFQEACATHGHTPPRHPVRQDVFVADTDAAAAAAVAPAIAAGYRGMDPDTLIHGSPARVAERFAAFAELGFTDVIVRQITVPQELALRSYELLGEVRALVADLGG
ncbi:MAG: LLM class flavin-dependent oxidoreductase [Acidimicrobiia bacterium]